jgi:hypothetical protein
MSLPPQPVERRAHLRLACKGTAKMLILPDGPSVAGVLLNFAAGGCAIESEAAIPAKRDAMVELQLDVRGFGLRLLGVIRYVKVEKPMLGEPEKTQAGIEFAEVSSRKAEQIRHLVAEVFDAEKERLARVKAVREAEDADDFD